MNKQQSQTFKKILSITNPLKRYEALHLFINSVFVDSLNGLNLTSLMNIDEVDVSNAEDILSHMLKMKRDLMCYCEQLKMLNDRMKKMKTINKVLSLVVGAAATSDELKMSNDEDDELNVNEIEEMVKRLDSLNVESINAKLKE